MVLTSHEAVAAATLALVKYHSKCRHSRFRWPDPAEEARGGGRAVLEAVGYADKVAEIGRAWGLSKANHDAGLIALAERDEARAERDDLAATVARVEALFALSPDTSCRTTWRSEDGPEVGQTECVEVPMDDLRAALDDPANSQPGRDLKLPRSNDTSLQWVLDCRREEGDD